MHAVYLLLGVLMVLFLTSCEDEETARKITQLEQENAELQGTIDAMTIALKDVNTESIEAEVSAAQDEVKKAQDITDAPLSEIESFEEKITALETHFLKFKRKHPLSE